MKRQTLFEQLKSDVENAIDDLRIAFEMDFDNEECNHTRNLHGFYNRLEDLSAQLYDIFEGDNA